MNRLQKNILYNLMTNPALSYSKLKPSTVEGNLFTYHLHCLIKEGLVLKQADGKYSLTTQGKRLSEGLSLKTMTFSFQPKMVTLIACQGKSGKWLLYRRKRQPMINMVGFPYGKIHLDEPITIAAQRELKEKTGLEAKLTHRGDGYITIYQDQQLASQIFFHLFIGNDPTGKLKPPTKVGEAFWCDLASQPKLKLIPSMPDLIKNINSKYHGRFFCELTYHI
jgi:ADP-ribose pyrophosphatase YjhB (NUDIX family)/predicted transcriptional regulator